MAKFSLSGLVVAGVLATGAANAQQVVNRTSDYTVTWSDSVFSNASALYQVAYAYAAGSPFTDAPFPITVLPNAQNFAYFQGGGVTVTSPTPIAPYPATVNATFSGDGTEGFWGWQYDTAAGAGLPISYGKLGNLATLNFDAGGFDSTVYSPGIGYFVFVYLPGDWTTEGTATGDYLFTSVADGFSTPTFTYDAGSGVTTVETVSTTFVGGAPDLKFSLIGSAVPEPATWAMMLFGFASIGLSAYRGSRKIAPIAV